MGREDCLNTAGAISGLSIDANNVYHGYLRAPDGTITVYDVPGGGTGPYQGTYPTGINDAGTAEGFDSDSSNVNHGFLRAADGTITTFDVPGEGTGPGQGTVANNINASGAITGNYIDANGPITVSYALRTAPSLPRSMFRARAQAPARAPSLVATTMPMQSPETTLMRAM